LLSAALGKAPSAKIRSVKASLPRAIYRALGKAFAEYPTLGKLLCWVFFIWHSVKPSLPSAEALPSVFYLALGEAFFAERPKKNARQSLRRSAKKRIPVVYSSECPKLCSPPEQPRCTYSWECPKQHLLLPPDWPQTTPAAAARLI
jgi:hypothetical protein